MPAIIAEQKKMRTNFGDGAGSGLYCGDQLQTSLHSAGCPHDPAAGAEDGRVADAHQQRPLHVRAGDAGAI